MIPVRTRAALQICAVLFLITAAAIAQNTIHVPAEQPTIQAAINVAAPGDTVVVAPGTYVENINFNGKAITVTSSDGSAATIIDGNASGTVVTFNQNETANAVLNGFTIRNGSAFTGAGISISGASPQITNNIVTGNNAYGGIGILIRDSSSLIRGNTITQNVDNMGSGGTGGGGILILGTFGMVSNPTITGNVITNNHTDNSGPGGGIDAEGNAAPVIQNNYIADNSSGGGGGGISAHSSLTVRIVGNVIANNIGGFYDQSNGPLLFANNTLYGNTFYQIATQQFYPLNSTYENNILYATSGTVVSCTGVNGVLTATNNIVYSLSPATSSECPAFAGSNGNIFADPRLVNPAAGAFHLHSDSPAIDAGVTVPNLPDKDGDGTTRVLDGNNDGTAIVDIGAYEFIAGGWAAMTPSAATFPGTSVVTSSAPVTFTLLNGGNADLTINSISVNGAFAQSNNCPVVLAVNATCVIQVTFTPPSSGTFSGTLSVASNGANATITALLSGVGSGATIHVPADQPTIQAAINAAATGDTVLVAPGTYFENIKFNGKAITVTSSDGAATTIIDAGGVGTVVTFDQNEPARTLLNGFTIRNGHAMDGAGIYVVNASPTITNNVIANNSGVAGVGIEVQAGSPVIQGNTVTANQDNLGSGPGAAIYITSRAANVTVVGNLIANNPLSEGGGVSIDYFASALIQDNQITGNHAYNGGGGIRAGSNGSVKIIGNVIANNSNGAGQDGGGFRDDNNGPLLFLNNTLYGNTTAYPNGASQIAMSTYARNSTFKNNIVYALSGTAITCEATSGVVTATNNIVYSVSPATNGSCAVFAESNGNIFAEPGMVNPAGGDFHLHDGSPGIDAGAGDNLPPTDLDGTTRVLDGNNDGTAQVDIGAYEFVPGAAPAGWAVLAPLGATFPSTGVGSSGGPVNFTLLNNGSAALTVNSIVVNGVFAQTNNCPAVLAVKATCLIQVTFSPTANGSFSGILIVATDGANGTVTAPLSGTGNGVFGTITPASLDFGQVTVGRASTMQSLTVTNTGTAPLVISSISLTAPFSKIAGGCSAGTSIAPGGTCGIGVIFRPSALGTVAGTLTVNSNAAAITPSVFNLSGTGAGPVISVTPNNLSFGTVTVGSSQTQVVTVSNTGNQSLTLYGTLYGFPISTNFSQTNNCGSTLAPGASCSMNVTFTPPAAQQYLGTLQIDSNTVVGNTSLPVSLSGAGVAPAISVAPSSLAFGQQLVGSVSAIKAISVSNTGSADLNISSITVTLGDFQQNNTCPAKIAPATSCTINLTFTPTSTGSQTGSLTINHDAPGSPTMIALTGTGIQPVVTLSATTLNFGNQLTGTSSPSQSVVLTNNGTAPLNISSISATSPFAQTNTCGTSLPAAASCNINVTFTPSGRGSISGALAVSTNAPSSPATVTLTGTGIAPVASVSPANLTFSSQLVGTTSPSQTLTLSNTGDATLSITAIVTTSPFAQSNTCGASLAAGASCAINVTFAPTSRGDVSGNLTINVGAPASNQTVALSGTGLAPQASFSATSLTFATQRVGTTSAPQTIVLSNTGNSALTISSIEIPAGGFSQTNDCSAPLAPASSCAISVTFQPTQSGAYNGQMFIFDDSGAVSGGRQDVFLTATGGASTATISPASLTFAITKLGTSTAPAAVTITNTGTMALNISSISASGDFSQTNNCAAVVTPGASCVANVVFTPIATGSRSGALTINSDAQNGVQTVSLSGTGAVPSAAVTPGSLNFATTPVGTQSSGAVTLSNNGPVPMNISSVATTGDFSQSNNCPATLPATSSCTINVTFVPSAAGTRTGTLTISDDAPGSPLTVSLSGSATDFSVVVSPTSVSINPGQNANYNVKVSAVGGAYNQTVSLTCSGVPAGATCTFTPVSVIPGSTSQTAKLKITTSNGGTPSGTYTIIVSGAVNSAARSGTATLIVK